MMVVELIECLSKEDPTHKVVFGFHNSPAYEVHPIYTVYREENSDKVVIVGIHTEQENKHVTHEKIRSRK